MADISFDLALRGYDRVQVDALVAEVESAFRSGDPELFAAARRRLEAAELAVSLRGYDPRQVDRYVASAKKELAAGSGEGSSPMVTRDFDTTLRGYDRAQVDAAVRTADDALASGDPFKLAAARDLLRSSTFALRWGGYDRAQVDAVISVLTAGLDGR